MGLALFSCSLVRIRISERRQRKIGRLNLCHRQVDTALPSVATESPHGKNVLMDSTVALNPLPLLLTTSPQVQPTFKGRGWSQGLDNRMWDHWEPGRSCLPHSTPWKHSWIMFTWLHRLLISGRVSLLENAGGHDFWLAYPPLIPSLADSDEASGHIVRCLMEKTWCQGTECGIWQQPAGTQGYPSWGQCESSLQWLFPFLLSPEVATVHWHLALDLGKAYIRGPSYTKLCFLNYRQCE
jgi:hypothetical protein